MNSEPKCGMCGVPWTEHDGCELLCRKYHYARQLLKELMEVGRFDYRVIAHVEEDVLPVARDVVLFLEGQYPKFPEGNPRWRCTICGGLVVYDGTAPEQEGHGK